MPQKFTALITLTLFIFQPLAGASPLSPVTPWDAHTPVQRAEDSSMENSGKKQDQAGVMGPSYEDFLSGSPISTDESEEPFKDKAQQAFHKILDRLAAEEQLMDVSEGVASFDYFVEALKTSLVPVVERTVMIQEVSLRAMSPQASFAVRLEGPDPNTGSGMEVIILMNPVQAVIAVPVPGEAQTGSDSVVSEELSPVPVQMSREEQIQEITVLFERYIKERLKKYENQESRSVREKERTERLFEEFLEKAERAAERTAEAIRRNFLPAAAERRFGDVNPLAAIPSGEETVTGLPGQILQEDLLSLGTGPSGLPSDGQTASQNSEKEEEAEFDIGDFLLNFYFYESTHPWFTFLLKSLAEREIYRPYHLPGFFERLDKASHSSQERRSFTRNTEDGRINVWGHFIPLVHVLKAKVLVLPVNASQFMEWNETGASLSDSRTLH